MHPYSRSRAAHGSTRRSRAGAAERPPLPRASGAVSWGMLGAGQLVEWGEGMDDAQGQSACAARRWEEVDVFLGLGDRATRVVRHGFHAASGDEHLARLTRRSEALRIEGRNGCVRELDLGLGDGGAP
jgi:hypothetical protein